MSTRCTIKEARDEASRLAFHLYEDLLEDQTSVTLEIRGFAFETSAFFTSSGEFGTRALLRIPKRWASKLGLIPEFSTDPLPRMNRIAEETSKSVPKIGTALHDIFRNVGGSEEGSAAEVTHPPAEILDRIVKGKGNLCDLDYWERYTFLRQLYLAYNPEIAEDQLESIADGHLQFGA
jgi:hypothetical protein